MVSAARISASVAVALLAGAARGFELPRVRFQRHRAVDNDQGRQHRLSTSTMWPTSISSSSSSSSRSRSVSSSSSYSVGHPRCITTAVGAGKSSPPAELAAATDDDAASYAADLKRTALWVAAAAGFAGVLAATKGVDSAVEFCSGYILEQCLSVDNLFVFLVLFDYFGVTRDKQDRVLSYGIWGAIVLRGLFIGVGAVTLQSFHQVTRPHTCLEMPPVAPTR